MLALAHPTTQTMIIGGAVAFVGEFIRLWGVAYAGSLTRVRTVGAPQVIVGGPFAYVRNPLYLGNMLLYVGAGIMSNALVPWLPVAMAVFFFIQYSLIVSLEEEFLEKEFGAAYLEFKKNVPRFFPRFVRYKSLAQETQHPNWSEALRSERRTFQAIALVFATVLVLWYRG